jgi:hypothetical protein
MAHNRMSGNVHILGPCDRPYRETEFFTRIPSRPLKAVNQDKPPRTLKGFRIRTDYQQRFDELAAHQKHSSGKKGPDLIEEALEMLFRKYDKTLNI